MKERRGFGLVVRRFPICAIGHRSKHTRPRRPAGDDFTGGLACFYRRDPNYAVHGEGLRIGRRTGYSNCVAGWESNESTFVISCHHGRVVLLPGWHGRIA